MRKESVVQAFELLLEEIDGLINQFNEMGGKCFSKGDHETARSILKDVDSLTNFRVKVQKLEEDWSDFKLSTSEPAQKTKKEKITRTSYTSLEQGKKTQSSAFRYPILKALAQLNGRARIVDVLEMVGEILDGTLNQYDRKPLPSDKRSIRWKNTAQWERFAMVQDGLLKDDSPRGIWELSEAGWRMVDTIGKREAAQKTLYPEE